MTDPVKDLSELRLTYQKGQLHEDSINPSPHQQFLQWFDVALQSALPEPYAMSVATADANGEPHVRTLLLRGASEQGYDFYSNYDSQKGHDLAANPRAQLLFYWPALEQQVRISGQVSRLDETESTAYYHKRPRDSQIAAHVSTPQSGVIDSRQALQARFDAAVQQFAQVSEIDKPVFWGGYRLVADYYEFWQGRPNRLHDRIRYQRQGESWQIERLMP